MASKDFKKKYLSSPITVIFVGLFVWYFLNNLEDFKPLVEIPAIALVIVLIAKLASHITNGIFIKLTVEVFTRKMSAVEGVYVAIISAIGNFFGPLLGGTTIRAYYLKKNHDLPYSFFTSTLAGYYLILFSINSFLAIISLLLLDESPMRSTLLLFFGAWLIMLLALMFIRLPDRARLGRLDKKRFAKFVWKTVYEIETGWHRLLKTRWMIPKLCLLAFGGFLITYFTAFVEFKAIGANISFAALGLYTVISISSMLISLTPGAIGIRESLLLLTASAMGVTNAQIIQVSIIDRAASFIVLGILYLILKLLKPGALPSRSSDNN